MTNKYIDNFIYIFLFFKIDMLLPIQKHINHITTNDIPTTIASIKKDLMFIFTVILYHIRSDLTDYEYNIKKLINYYYKIDL